MQKNDVINKKQSLGKPGHTEDLLECGVCGTYFRKAEGFICPRCKRGPVCKTHQFPGSKECTSCMFEKKSKELNGMKDTESGLKAFLNFLQFMFLLFSVYFVAHKIGVTAMVWFLEFDIITSSLPYMGGISVVGCIIVYIILYSHRNSIHEMESNMRKYEFRRLAK